MCRHISYVVIVHLDSWETRTLQGLFLCSFFSDNNEGSSSSNQPIFAMAGDGTSSDVKIPAVLLFFEEGQILRRAVTALEDTNRSLRVRLAAKASGQGWYNRVLKWWRHKKDFFFSELVVFYRLFGRTYLKKIHTQNIDWIKQLRYGLLKCESLHTELSYLVLFPQVRDQL